MAVIRHIDFEAPGFGEFAEGPREHLGYRSLVLSLEPVAYWRLGEASGTVAVDEMGTADGVYETGVTLGQGGALVWDDDPSAEFNGDDGHVTLGTIGVGHPLQLAGVDFTVAVWFKQRSGGDRYQRILDKTNSHTGIAGYTVLADPLERWLTIHVDGNWYMTGAGAYTFGAWHCAAFVVTDSAYRIYVDGVEVSGSFLIGSAKHAPGVETDARVGSWNHSDQREWNGWLDELAVWDRALTDDQVAQLYRMGVGG